MKHGLPFLAGLVLSGAAVSPAFSQTYADDGAAQAEPGFMSRFDVEHELDADLLWAAGDVHAPREAPYVDLRYRLSAETVRADGVRWGVRLGLGAVSHDGGRGAGGAVDCAPSCPTQGLVTGLFAAPGFDAADARAGLHRAELYVRHPYVEVRAGLTDTAAALERPARTRAFRLAGADGALADPTGRALTDTGLSLTAPAPGVSVQTRRLAGFRAAVSYTPDADPCGVDHCRPVSAGGAETGAVGAAGLSFDRRAPTTGVRWAAYAGAEIGALDRAAGPRFEDPWTAGLAAVREAGGVTLAARWLVSNDGLSRGRYESASITAAWERGDWLYSAEAGHGSSEAFAISASTFVAGASRFVGRNALLGAGVQITHHDRTGGRSQDEAALVVETGLRF